MTRQRQFSVNWLTTARKMVKISLVGRPAIILHDDLITAYTFEKALLLFCYLAMKPAAGGHPHPALATRTMQKPKTKDLDL